MALADFFEATNASCQCYRRVTSHRRPYWALRLKNEEKKENN